MLQQGLLQGLPLMLSCGSSTKVRRGIFQIAKVGGVYIIGNWFGQSNGVSRGDVIEFPQNSLKG